MTLQEETSATRVGAKPLGRPRAFDEQVLLAEVLEVFWRQGYDATSMADLVRATGVNSPSLYNAFGNKEALYRRAVELYVEREDAINVRKLAETPRLADAIRGLLESQVRRFTQFDPPRGCLIVRSVGDASTIGPDMHERLRNYRREVGLAIRARVERAVVDGELAPDEDPVALADQYHNFLSGLSVQIADGIPAERLQAAISRLVEPVTGHATRED